VQDYRADCAKWPVERGVYVEAEWDPRDPRGEMNFISQIMKAHRFPTVAIAQAWLHHADCPAVLESHAARGFVRGVRHKPKPGMMDDRTWRDGYRRLAPLGLHFELQCPWPQLDEAARLASDFPDTTIVLNHTGLPDASDGWLPAMRQLSACPNATVKISGMGVPQRDALLSTIELFGTARAMFASNFPVDSLRASFDRIYSDFSSMTSEFPSSERRALFYGNAVRIYRMEPAA
jgi:predicted TIM-barrel fold metal-dependent hydrolase